MNAETIARALGGRKSGKGWSARCPAHDDSKPSLSLTDSDNGRVLIYCHAGCDQNTVINELKSTGLWTVTGRRPFRRAQSRRTAEPSQPSQDEINRRENALSIWEASEPAQGTPAETYLASRGLQLPPTTRLRFHPHLLHIFRESWPAMVALVTHGSDDAAIGIHRTFLSRDGIGKAPINLSKMMLGPCRGGAVRLAETSDVLMIGEGIETCLAAMQATGQPAWAALSTSGLRGLVLPQDVRNVIVLADGDDPGEAAARDCAIRMKYEGRRVRIARPPKGMDFNDLLVGHVSSIVEGAK